MRSMTRAGMGVVLAAAMSASLMAGPAAAQELSDESIKKFMEFAWSLVPAKFTKPDGTTVEIDKKQKDKVVVPIETAREIIKAGRMSAHAQVCDLAEDQVLNYRSLMKRESDKKKWSEQQMIYINQLHLTTVMLLTGKIKLIEKEGDEKQVVIDDAKKGSGQSCTPEQKQKVKDVITAYVKSGPPVSAGPATAAAGAGGGAAPAAAPAAAAPAAEKKK